MTLVKKFIYLVLIAVEDLNKKLVKVFPVPMRAELPLPIKSIFLEGMLLSVGFPLFHYFFKGPDSTKFIITPPHPRLILAAPNV